MGSTQLLMSQKFQQFYWLCQQNMVSKSPGVLGSLEQVVGPLSPLWSEKGTWDFAEQGANATHVPGWGLGW